MFCNKHKLCRLTALLHISLVLCWLGTCSNFHEQSSTALLHISRVMRSLGTYLVAMGLLQQPYYTLIRDMPQHAWDLLDCPFTHASCLKAVGDILQHAWFVAHGLVAHFLCFKMRCDLSYPTWNFFIRRTFLCSWTQARVKFDGQKKWFRTPQSINVFTIYLYMIFVSHSNWR